MIYKILGMTKAAKQVESPTFEVSKGITILYKGKSIKKAKEIADKNGRKVYAYIWRKYYNVVFTKYKRGVNQKMSNTELK